LYHATRAPAVDPLTALAIVAAAMASYLVVATLVPAGASFVAAQAALAVVAIAAARAADPARPARILGLSGAPPRLFAAAISIGATAWYINMRLVALLPVPERDARALERIVERPSLPAALIIFALVPAVCEELVFRGVLARALGRRLPLVGAAAISALAFSAYHLSLVQALPTATLGTVLAVLAIRADSVLPAVLAHAINNAIAIAMSRGELPQVAGWLAAHPVAAFTACSAATMAGVALAVREAA
jgi:membrane protease YdiL (CAAX protease family)